MLVVTQQDQNPKIQGRKILKDWKQIKHNDATQKNVQREAEASHAGPFHVHQGT